MTNTYVFEKLKNFIVKETFVDVNKINPNTKIELDLGVTGDDATDFIRAFSREFGVETSGFNISRYFRGEGDKTLKSVFSLIKGENLCNDYFELTVKDLEQAILVGKLDDSLIGFNQGKVLP